MKRFSLPVPSKSNIIHSSPAKNTSFKFGHKSVFLQHLLTISGLFACTSVLPAQVITLPLPVKSLSVNADGNIIAASDKSSVALYETPSYTPITSINEQDINRMLFYGEGKEEFLITMTENGDFSLQKREKRGKKITFLSAERYSISDPAEDTDKKKAYVYTIQ